MVRISTTSVIVAVGVAVAGMNAIYGLPVASGYAIDWYTMDGGGVTFSIGDHFELAGTVGQPDAGVMAGGSYELEGGFWPGSLRCRVADFDCDGDVDLNDFATFAGCLHGVNVTIPPENCSAREFADCDLTGDGDVDMADFAEFAVNFGP